MDREEKEENRDERPAMHETTHLHSSERTRSGSVRQLESGSE
jgi:hypothetical protein